MRIDTKALFDELSKIAEEARAQSVTRERVLRSLKAGLAAAGGMGLGWGVGNLLSDTVLPNTLQRYLPRPTPSQLQKGMLVAGGIGSLGSLAHDVMRNRLSKYVNTDPNKQPKDMLMGHEKLNPESKGGQA